MSAYLFEEPSNLMKQECREPMQYNAIIKSIAEGAVKISEISTVSGLNDTSLTSNYINKLISLGIVEKNTLINQKAPKKLSIGYLIICFASGTDLYLQTFP